MRIMRRPMNPDPFLGLPMWARYKASSMASVGNGNALSQWDDISGNARHATQATSARRPIMRTAASGLVGNTNAVEFIGTDTDPHVMGLPSMVALTAGSIFVACKTLVPDSGNNNRLWEMGTSVDGYHTYSITVYETFGTQTRRQMPSAASAGTFSVWHKYSVEAATNYYDMRLNNSSVYSNSANVVGFSSSPAIGGRPAGTSGLRLAQKHIAEIIISSAVPTTAQRTAVYSYFSSEYGF